MNTRLSQSHKFAPFNSGNNPEQKPYFLVIDKTHQLFQELPEALPEAYTDEEKENGMQAIIHQMIQVYGYEATLNSFFEFYLKTQVED